MVKSIYAYSAEELGVLLGDLPKFRVRQILDWRSRGLLSFDDYKNLDNITRSVLQNKTLPFSSTLAGVQKAQDSSKILIQLYDGLRIESVIMFGEGGTKTVCLSSQGGCACGCKFCATGTLGLKRNLESWEIIEQYYHLKRLFGKINKVVYMGMGEPLLNLSAVSSSIEYFKLQEGLSPRRITVSTCGIAKGIKELAELGLGVKLTLSLVIADQEKRKEIMPTAATNSLGELKKALQYFQTRDNRRITLAYCLLSGINTDPKSLSSLQKFADGLVCHINLIPWNPIKALNFKAPSQGEVRRVEQALGEMRLACSTRYSKGSGISAACGQLVADARSLGDK